MRSQGKQALFFVLLFAAVYAVVLLTGCASREAGYWSSVAAATGDRLATPRPVEKPGR